MGDTLATGVGYGKIILLGEHAVVYGKPALAAAIARGCRATATAAERDTLSVAPWGATVFADSQEREPSRELLRRAFAQALDAHAKPRSALHLHAVLEIPGSAGLGGSAALGVAVIRALDAALGVVADEARTLAAALEWERVFHGNPSGVDSTMATRGGLALYRKGEPLQPVRPGKSLVLVVGVSGEPGSTMEMVAQVARQHARDPGKTGQIFDAIEAVVNNGRSALTDGDHARLGQLLDLNQKLLNTLMLSTTKLESMCGLARERGALGAKLTGGGGGGSMIALASDEASAQGVAGALRYAGYEAFVVEVKA